MKLSVDEIRKITLEAIRELGDKATPELVKKIVTESVNKTRETPVLSQPVSLASDRIILTSFGLNHPGIVAAITGALSEADCDIQDLSQKIMQDFYTMIMLVDISNSSRDLKSLQEEMNKIAEKLKIRIYLQHEDLFTNMHRI